MHWQHARLLALALAVLLAACLPVPHRENETPHVVGRLVRDRSPASGIPVALSVTPGDSLCVASIGEARTQRDGRFDFPARRTWEWWLYLILAHRSYHWQLCVGPAGARLPAYQATIYTPADAPTDSVRCELSSNAPSATCRGRFGLGERFRAH
jgi:hypothetical protein